MQCQAIEGFFRDSFCIVKTKSRCWEENGRKDCIKGAQVGGYCRSSGRIHKFGLGNNERLRIVNIFEMYLGDRINRTWCYIVNGIFWLEQVCLKVLCVQMVY